MGKVILGIFGAFVLLIVILIIAAVGTYNGLVNRSQAVDAQWAQVQNVYQRRTDLIPNLVNTVSGAANFEKTTLMAVTEARASVGKVQLSPTTAPTDPTQLAQFEQAQGQLSSALSRLLVVVERYPELKATQNFQMLQAQLEGTENRIAVERGRFNDVARDYNAAIKRIPTVFFAAALGFKEKAYFNATPGAEKPPAVQFDFSAKPAPAKP
ncbi:MAG: LemA family protein [Opitutaceae bacterium]|jgi:LemA protein